MRKGCKRNKPRFGTQGPKCWAIGGSNTARMSVSVLVETWKGYCERERKLWYVAVRCSATETQTSGWSGTADDSTSAASSVLLRIQAASCCKVVCSRQRRRTNERRAARVPGRCFGYAPRRTGLAYQTLVQHSTTGPSGVRGGPVLRQDLLMCLQIESSYVQIWPSRRL
jgi:hypothetical protein